MTNEEAQKLISRAAESLGEQFDAVFVVASRSNPNEPEFTQIIQAGSGNWFAQRGMLREVLDKDAQVSQANRIRQALDEKKGGE